MSVRKEIELLAEYCDTMPGLNIGCGDVQIGKSMGVDLSHKARACEVVADAMDLPFPTETFNYIVAAACFEHLEVAPILVLRHWLSVLKPGGIIAIVVPDAEYGIWSMTGDTGKPGKLVKPRREMEHLHAFTIESLRVLFEFAGMDIVRLEKIDRKPYRNETTILCVGKKNLSYENCTVN